MKALLPAAALCINIVFGNTMNIALNGQTFTATSPIPRQPTPCNNSCCSPSICVTTRNEKVGPLPQALPANDEAVGHIEAGDILLWQGDSLVIFYESFATPYVTPDLAKSTMSPT